VKLKYLSAISVCALLLAACNKAPTDQGTSGQSSSSTTDRGSSSAPADRSVNPSGSQSGVNAVTTTPSPANDTNNLTPKVTSPTAADTAASKPADNTGRNVRDRSDAAVTPGNQSNDKADLELTRQLRRAITENKQFSTSAKNIKIVTQNGKVTLRGPVKTDAEKQQIADLVKGTEGVLSVDNELEVKGSE